MTTTHVTRSDLLSSRLFYDKHRDGPDALPTGTPHTQVPYTGKVTDIRLDDSFALARAVYVIRANPGTFEPSLVDYILDTREGRIPPGLWDWDCRYCQVAVMTEIGDTACPHCLLT